MESIDSMVAAKFSKKIQKVLTFAEHDSWGKYHIVVNDPSFGEASFHETSIAELKWQIGEFLKDGSRF